MIVPTATPFRQLSVHLEPLPQAACFRIVVDADWTGIACWLEAELFVGGDVESLRRLA